MRHRIPLPRRNDQAERSAPRPPCEKPDYGRWAHREGRNAEWRGFRIPALRPAPFRGSGLLAACHAACDWEADRTVGGRF